MIEARKQVRVSDIDEVLRDLNTVLNVNQRVITRHELAERVERTLFYSAPALDSRTPTIYLPYLADDVEPLIGFPSHNHSTCDLDLYHGTEALDPDGVECYDVHMKDQIDGIVNYGLMDSSAPNNAAVLEWYANEDLLNPTVPAIQLMMTQFMYCFTTWARGGVVDYHYIYDEVCEFDEEDQLVVIRTITCTLV